MGEPDGALPAWARLGDTTHGVWTAADALRAGLSRDDVRGAVRSRRWQVVRRGVFADGGVALPAEARAAGVLSVLRDDAVLAGRSAARLHGLPLIDDADPLLPPHLQQLLEDDVLVRCHVRARPRLHVSRATLSDEDVVVLAGLPCTSVVRTLVDLPGIVGHAASVCAWDAALHRHLTSHAALTEAVEARAGRHGARSLRGVLAVTDARAESALESLGRLCLAPVVPTLAPQVVVRDASGRPIARVDLGEESLRLAVEGDGRRGHAGADMVHKDRRRDASLLAAGWVVERYGWYDVRLGRAALQHRVALVAERRRRAPAA